MAKPVGLPEFLVASLTLLVLCLVGLGGDALGPIEGACSGPACENRVVNAFFVRDAAEADAPLLVIPAADPLPKTPTR
jgi:hypothetical protein